MLTTSHTPRTGTRVQRAVLALLPALDVTHDSLAAHLSDAWGRGVDRTLVSRWTSGDRSMPLDVVVEIARHASAQLGEVDGHVAERVLGPVLRAVGCVAVRVPDASSSRSVISQAWALIGTFGAVQVEVTSALADGELDDGERGRLVQALDGVILGATRLREVLAARDGGR